MYSASDHHCTFYQITTVYHMPNVQTVHFVENLKILLLVIIFH